VCRRHLPFLEKLADIAVLGRQVGDMSATFPAKIGLIKLPELETLILQD
jgi:hypothetical protein